MRMTLGYQVLLALLFGILVGLFFGPLAVALKPIGDVYTMLLQMAVLPYICFSLIHGLGSILPETGKKLIKNGWPYLLGTWILVFGMIVILMQLIPESNAPLIRVDTVEAFKSNFTKNFLTYLIPENPLYDIANNIVPAVAIFGLLGGIALMHIKSKEPLLGVLERINQTIEKILKWLGILSPLAAFTYVSIAFGTIELEDLLKLEVYVVTFIFGSLFITFWLIPTLLSTLTPLNFKEASKAIRFVCLLPFVTGLSTAAIPFLNIFLKDLSKQHATHEKFRETSQTVLPIAYSFGNIGNAMTLFIMIFLAYYFRHPFTGVEKWLVSILTIPLSLGSTTTNINSIHFLIDQLSFPNGTFEFYLGLKSLTYNFQVMMSVAGVLALILLTIYSYYGMTQIPWKKLLLRLSLSFSFVAILVFSLQKGIQLPDRYHGLYMNQTITEVIKNPVPSEILLPGQKGTPRTFDSNRDPESLKQILSSKVLKVGFNTVAIPFCYYNNHSQLVGFDIAYAYNLAKDLNSKIEFVPLNFAQMGEELWDGTYDIAMSSIIMDENRLTEMNFSFPYSQSNNVLVVPVSRKNQYLNLKEVRERVGTKIGAGGAQVSMAAKNFQNAIIVDLINLDPLVKGEIDALFWSKSTALVWCISHPDFVAIEYGNQLGKCYFGYPIRLHAIDFGFYLNNWLALKEQSGFKQEMTSYWIDGISPEKKKPRWSILKDVLNIAND